MPAECLVKMTRPRTPGKPGAGALGVMSTRKLVHLGAAHDCYKCGARLTKGAKAYKSSRPAMTYHERTHSVGGLVSWYFCLGCGA